MVIANNRPAPKRIKISSRTKRILCVVNGGGAPVCTDTTFLCWHAASGRYYVHPSKPRKYIGYDLEEAIYRFREKTNPPTPFHIIPTTINEKASALMGYPVPNVEVVTTTGFWEYVRNLILTDPNEAARLTRIPELARLSALPEPEPPLSLADILTAYTDRRKPLSAEEGKKARNAWKKFTSLVGVKMLADVNEKRFAAVANFVDTKMVEEWSARSARSFLTKIHAVLNHTVTRGKDTKNGHRVLGYLTLLKDELPNGEGDDPRPLSRDEWNKLYEASKGTPWEPKLLLALNCAFYGIDLCRVPVAAIDWENKTLVFARKKKSTVRVAVLWDRTIESLKAWFAEHPSESTIFLSEEGAGYAIQGLRNSFRRFRKNAGLPKTITIDRVRDSAYSRAIEGGIHETEAKLLGGHKLSGKADAYTKRNPRMVAKACEIIEAYYFGGK